MASIASDGVSSLKIMFSDIYCIFFVFDYFVAGVFACRLETVYGVPLINSMFWLMFFAVPDFILQLVKQCLPTDFFSRNDNKGEELVCGTTMHSP